jgi:hypothetical protein
MAAFRPGAEVDRWRGRFMSSRPSKAKPSGRADRWVRARALGIMTPAPEVGLQEAPRR